MSEFSDIASLRPDQDIPVSVVIPAYNAAATIGRTIDACLAQTGLPEALEVIVVDDGSQDHTAIVAQRYPVKVISQANSGPAAARNAGYRAARGRVICFTDADCIPAEDWVATLLRGFQSQEIGAVAGSYEPANPESWLATCIQAEIVVRHLQMGQFIRAFGTYNVAIIRRALDEVDGFEPTFRRASGEDNDLSYKLLKAGYKITFCRDARVAHFHPTRVIKYMKEQARHGFWRAKIYRRHPDMTRGDDYTLVKDIVEPPLALTIVLGLVTSLVWPQLRPVVMGLTIVQVIIQAPMTKKIIALTGRRNTAWFGFVTFVRGFARALGLAAVLALFRLEKPGTPGL
ncbi:MAG: glycosyltransferase [Deltaproteobacteria bacterium]|nr:glycosyltransferase [Deltaproteobacteria bacterium]